jgi:proteasome lid subunit RPN8/RPN11
VLGSQGSDDVFEESSGTPAMDFQPPETTASSADPPPPPVSSFSNSQPPMASNTSAGPSPLGSNSSSTIHTPSDSVPLASTIPPMPQPKRMRPSQMSNLSFYQDTIMNPPPEIHIPVANFERTSSCSSHLSSSSRWSSAKNIRNITTGQLDLGVLPILVSPDLVDQFMHISSNNSMNKIETGGLLGGVLEDSCRFKVTTLLIPKQTGRSDCWEAVDEARIQTYFENQGLLLLGCIHTHPPPWTSFLSSVDLHQLFDFQKENPSAISIVIAPAHMPDEVPALGYSLTDLGLTVLADCRKRGFHQHRYN